MTDREAIEYFEAIFETEVLGKTDIEAMNIAISALRERENRAMNWISVKERLPENGVPVLVYGVRGYGIAFHTDKSFPTRGEWMGFYDLCNRGKVTHWMPLPEPPKEEA